MSASPRLSYDNPLWPDLLTAVNGNPITYDQSGNPTRWHDGTEFTWTNGRQLVRAQNTRTGLDVTFTYDENGIRTGKLLNRNGVITEHTFYTQNGRIVGEVRRNANGMVTDRLEFIYDEAGRPVQMIHNGNTFNYVLNLQGDVQQIRCAWTGEVVATYMYNAFGEIWGAEGRMARINPLLYRGYFLCSSLGMYYLQSRYYDPWIGRFINADATWVLGVNQGSFLQFNLFTYCLNNPVMLVDPTGFVGSHWASPNDMAFWYAMNAWGHAQLGNTATANEYQRRSVAQQARRPTNTNPQAVIYAMEFYNFVWYRRTPVVRTSGLGGSFAIGEVIWLDEAKWNPDDVSHEWGHTLQERFLGPRLYIPLVAIPSLITAQFDFHDSMPWERSATFLSDLFSGRLFGWG